MAATPNLYIAPDKNVNDQWSSAEHNQLKLVHNINAQKICNNEDAVVSVRTDLDSRCPVITQEW